MRLRVELSDFKVTLDVLKAQRHLTHLDLSANPIAEEKDYRLHVVKQLPWLEVLDRHKVRRRLGLGLGFGLRATIYEQSARHEWFLLTVDAPL